MTCVMPDPVSLFQRCIFIFALRVHYIFRDVFSIYYKQTNMVFEIKLPLVLATKFICKFLVNGFFVGLNETQAR